VAREQLTSTGKSVFSAGLQRAATDIPACIAEGWGRNNEREWKHQLMIARGVLCVVLVRLDVILRLEHLMSHQIDAILERGAEPRLRAVVAVGEQIAAGLLAVVLNLLYDGQETEIPILFVELAVVLDDVGPNLELAELLQLANLERFLASNGRQRQLGFAGRGGQLFH